MNRDTDIEQLRQELNRLRLEADNIERLLTAAQVQREVHNQPEEEDRRPPIYRHTHPVVRDREGVEILIGDQVEFITRGLFTSTRGVVYKIVDSGSRVTARDQFRRSISRAPHNVRVILPSQ